MLSVSTELSASLELTLRTNLPPGLAACRALAGAPCEDADGDMLVDAWEDLVLDRMRPFVRLDEDEDLVDDTNSATAIVGRVFRASGHIHVYMMLGYSKDYGSCGGFTSHNGDSERVALELELLGTAGDARVRKAYTAAHEGTVNDHGQVFESGSLSTLVHENDPAHGQPRWVVFASANKHATYATNEIYEGVSIVPCVDEDCSPDGVSDLEAYTLLMPYVNAGEPTTPIVSDLTAVGFPGDDAWADKTFCGGLGGSGCSSSVRSKLLTDPF